MAGTGEDYAAFLMRQYGAGLERTASDSMSDCTTSVATHEQRAPPARQRSRPLTPAERLSRNRAAKRAVSDTTLINHLSTMYHMNRRIYESYRKAGLLGQGDEPGASRPGTSCAARAASVASGRPATAPTACFAGSRQPARGAAAQAGSGRLAPAGAASIAAVYEPAAAPPGAVPAQEPAPRSSTAPAAGAPSYVKRHVQNSKAALKAAILDEIVEHRLYEGTRLKALFRSYLKLNSGEAFYPTLAEVVEELRAELGVA